MDVSKKNDSYSHQACTLYLLFKWRSVLFISKLFFKDVFIFNGVYKHLCVPLRVQVYTCVYTSYVQVSTEAKSGQSIPRSWNYKELSAARYGC